tara:strand:+ start:364 stop:2031 length:1668 start_codon:yes stop_codon:yes gene_type:complete
MCGLAGYIFKEKTNIRKKKILKSLSHRGPDANGVYSLYDKIYLFHTRLSIIDLSKLSNQPFQIDKGNLTIVFNGEIYNYKELQKELSQEGEKFLTNSDTEVFLKLWRKYGINGLNKARGMFAFAIYDKKKKLLTIGRDPLGIKPLFYNFCNNVFSFSSEINQLKNKNYNVSNLGQNIFDEWGSIPPPLTIYKNIKSVEPGSVITFSTKDLKIKKYYYWKLSKIFEKKRKYINEYKSAVEKAKNIITESISSHLTADVPVAILLSGGIDSSAMVSFMKKLKIKKINTISLIFPGTKYNENKYIKMVSKKFNTIHYQKKYDKKEFKKEYKKYKSLTSYPTIDGFNVYLVTKFARKNKFKVVLSGVGADEIFQGYKTIFTKISFIIRISKLIPYIFKKIFIESCKMFFKDKNLYFRIKKLILSKKITKKYLSSRDLKVNQNLSKKEAGHLDLFYNKYFKISDKSMELNRWLSFMEIKRYLQSQLLLDCDYFSMLNSVEVRTPFVDKVFYEKMLDINPALFKNKRYNKSILVDAAEDLPVEIVKRKKMGFTLPMNWLTK